MTGPLCLVRISVRVSGYDPWMELRGYMIEVKFDGQTLVAEGTNKASQIALRGEDRNLGPVQVPVSQIASVDFKNANAVTNGRILVHTIAGKRYQITFRRKDRDAFQGLYNELESARANA